MKLMSDSDCVNADDDTNVTIGGTCTLTVDRIERSVSGPFIHLFTYLNLASISSFHKGKQKSRRNKKLHGNNRSNKCCIQQQRMIENEATECVDVGSHRDTQTSEKECLGGTREF